MVRARRLTPAGLVRFSEELDAIRSGEQEGPSSELLGGSQFTAELDGPIEVAIRPFASRFELAEYVYRAIPATLQPKIEPDAGFWAWLGVLWFDQLCPTGRDGRRKPGESARWIPSMQDYKRYYRHLVAGPYHIYSLHGHAPECTAVILAGAPSQSGELYEQLASRQELISNPVALQVASRLYLDRHTGAVRRGAAGRNAGSARRFAAVLRQFDVTWDLVAISADELMTLLPREFARFIGTAANP